MAVNRYVEWAQQPVIERAPDYLQQNIPLPFQELMAVGQLRQKEYDDTAKNMSLLGNGLLNLEGLKEVVLSSGQRLPVADADRISQAQRDLIEFQNEMAGRDLGDPKNREIVRQKAAELAARVAPTGDLGRIDANAKAFKALRQEFQKQKDPEKRQGRFLDFDRQLYDYYAGASDKIVPTAFGEYTDINKNIQDGLKGMDPELDDIYAIQENPNDPLYIRVREGMRAGVYDDRIRSAFNSFWPQSDAKAALEGKIRDTIALAQYEGRPLTDNRGREVSPEEFYKASKASMEETRRNLEDYAVQLYRKSEGKENLSIQQKNEFIVGQEGNKIEEPGEVIPVQTIEGNAFENPLVKELPKELKLDDPNWMKGIKSLETFFVPGKFGPLDRSTPDYQYAALAQLVTDPELAQVLKPIMDNTGFWNAKGSSQKASVTKKVLDRYKSYMESFSKKTDQVRVASPEIVKDREATAIADRDDKNWGTFLNRTIYDPKFGKALPAAEWINLVYDGDVKKIKSKLRHVGVLRPYTGEEMEIWNFDDRQLRVSTGSQERKTQLGPAYNAIGEVLYGKKSSNRNADVSAALGYPDGTYVMDIYAKDLWRGDKHVGRTVYLKDKAGREISLEKFNDLVDRADVYYNQFTQGATRTGGIDPKLRKDIDIRDSGE